MNISRPNPEPAPRLNTASGLNSSTGVVQSGALPSATSGAHSPSQKPAGPAPISDLAQLSALSSVLASALEGSPAHVAKVSELGAAVSSGRYRVDANAVSGSIIQDSLAQHSLTQFSPDFGGSGLLAANT